MKKLMGGTLVLALASLGWAAPQRTSTPANDNSQATKQTSKKSAKHTKKHSKKSNTQASQTAPAK